VLAQRFEGVAAARGSESAWRRAAVEGALIPDDQANQEGRRRSNCVRSNCSSMNDRPTAVGCAPNRYIPGGKVPADDASCNMTRNWRRTRLRSTAGPSARPRANATRGGVVMPGGSRMYVHHRTPARARWPSAAKRANARRSRRRQIKPTDACGPWRGVTSTRHVRRGCSSGGGSRASWPGGGCWVGRCASRSPPRAARGSTSRVDNCCSERRAANHQQRPEQLPRLRWRATQWQPPRQMERPEVFRSVEGRKFGSVRPPRRMVVHTMWTRMWISIDRREGGAGERP
jgi:hypothetical protein